MLIAKIGRLAPMPVLLALAVSGCNNTPPPNIGLVTAQPVSEFGQTDYSATEAASYVLLPADVISVTVFREPDLSLESASIGAGGLISLPLLGTVDTTGMTSQQLGQKIEQSLSGRYLTSPHVAVNVIDYASHVVTVEGAVEKPGIFKTNPATRLSGAIALASGPSRVAKVRQIAVFRTTPQGIAIAKFDYAAMQQGTMIDPILQPNDRVVVGTSGLSQFWQDLLKTLPAFALFTQI